MRTDRQGQLNMYTHRHTCWEYNNKTDRQLNIGWHICYFPYQGMFVVALPYGVYHGGYWAILAMVGIAHICCHTGKILVDCLYEEPDEHGYRHKIRFSYKVMSKQGYSIINFLSWFKLKWLRIWVIKYWFYVYRQNDLSSPRPPSPPFSTTNKDIWITLYLCLR